MSPAAREDVAGYLAAMAAIEGPPLEALPVDVVRAITAQQSMDGDLAPVPLALVKDVVLPRQGEGALHLRLYDRRSERPAGPLVLFFHGGGFVFGGLETHHSFCTWLADHIDLPVLATEYRLAPEHPFPAAIEDAEAVARWAANSPIELGRTVSSLVSCGDSAGGNLAVVLAAMLEAHAAPVPLIGQIALYPYCGAGTDWPSFEQFGEGYMLTRGAGDWFDRCYDAPPGDPRVNLLAGTVPDVPLAILTSELDPLRDAGRAYARRVAEAGKPVMHQEALGMIHGFVNLRKALGSSVGDLEKFFDDVLPFMVQEHSQSQQHE
jgi:acetyl esterase